MRILYLHGYKARPNYERIDYLKSLYFVDEVIAPHIDYDNEPNIMLELLEQDYDMVIGSSLGAYMGFYISDYKSIPAICFNPPLYMDLKVQMNTPKDWDYESVVPNDKVVVVGVKDTVVDPGKTIDWLLNNRTDVEIMPMDEMTHTITIEEFIKVFERVLGRKYQWKR